MRLIVCSREGQLLILALLITFLGVKIMSEENQIIELNQLVADNYLKQGDYIKAFEYYTKNLVEISLYQHREIDFFAVINNIVLVAEKIASQAENKISKLNEIKNDLMLSVPENEFLYAAFVLIDYQILDEIVRSAVGKDQVDEAFSTLCHNLNSYSTYRAGMHQNAQFDTYIVNIENNLREYLKRESKIVTLAFQEDNYHYAYERSKTIFELSNSCLSKDLNHSVYMANYGISAFKFGRYVEAQKYLYSAAKMADSNISEVVQRFFEENTKSLIEASKARDFSAMALDLMLLANSGLLEEDASLAVKFVKKAKEIVYLIERSEDLSEKFQVLIQDFKINAQQNIVKIAATKNFSAAVNNSLIISNLLQDIGDTDSRYFDSFAAQNYISQNDCQHALPLLRSSISIYQEVGKQYEASVLQAWIDSCAGQVQNQESEF